MSLSFSRSCVVCLGLFSVALSPLASAQDPISLGGVAPPRAVSASETSPVNPAPSPTSLMDLQERLSTLESTLQGQTQQLETLQNIVRTLEKKLADTPKAVPAPTDTAPETDTVASPPSPSEPSPTLGQATPSAPLEDTHDTPPSEAGTYQTGIDALKQGQYAEARDHFTAFIKNNPDDKMVPNAYYWMGEAYYAEGNYRKSGETFLKAFQDYPDSPKAPDSLLKLGLSLQSAKQHKQACLSFDELLRRYPQASPAVLQRAKRAKAACG